MAVFNEDRAWERAQQFFDQHRVEESLAELDKLIRNSDSRSRYAYVKAYALTLKNRFTEALETLNRSIEMEPNWSQAHKLKAELLYNYFSSADNLQIALSEINQALELYGRENISQNVLDNAPEAFPKWLDDFVATRTDMANLKVSIENEIRANQILSRIEQVETNMMAERFKNMEILGVFAAIIALVLATSQAATKLQGLDFLWLGFGLVLPLSFLVILVSPRGDARIKGLMIIVGVAISGGVIGYLIK